MVSIKKSVIVSLFIMIVFPGFGFKRKDSIINDSNMKLNVVIDSIHFKQGYTSPKSDIIISNNLPEEKTDWVNIIVPIVTLLIGFGLNRGYEWWTNKRKVKSEGKHWMEQLILLKGPLKNQIEGLEDYITKNPADNFEMTDLQKETELSCSQFDSLSKEMLLQYLKQNYESKSFNDTVIVKGKIEKIIRVIQYNSNLIDEKFIQLKKGVSDAIEAYNKEFQSLMHAFKYYGAKIEQITKDDPSNHPPMKAAWDLYEKYIKPNEISGNINLLELEDLYFAPLADALYADREMPEVLELTTHATNCRQQIKRIRAEKEYMLINSQKLIVAFEKAQKSLEEILSELKLEE